MPQVAKVIAMSARKTCRTSRCFCTKSNMKGRDSTSRGASGRRSSGRKVERQHLGGAPGLECQPAVLDLQRVPRAERLSVHLEAAAGDVHIALALGRELEPGALSGVEQARVDARILVDEERAVVPIGRGDEPQPPPLFLGREALLLVFGRDAGQFGLDP